MKDNFDNQLYSEELSSIVSIVSIVVKNMVRNNALYSF